MYIARFSYDVLPVDRDKALEFVRREAAEAERTGLRARILVPFTRGPGSTAALQFEIELTSLDQLDQFRQRSAETSSGMDEFMHTFSQVLRSPPIVEVLRVHG